MMRLISALVVLLTISALTAHANPYFTAQDDSLISPPGWRVTEQFACPASDTDTETYTYFPQTICTAPLSKKVTQSTWDQGNYQFEVWANRCLPVLGTCGLSTDPNWIDPAVYCNPTSCTTGNGTARCYTNYTTHADADAATEAEVSYALGYSAHNNGLGYLDITEATGKITDDNVVHVGDLANNPGEYCTMYVVTGKNGPYYLTNRVGQDSCNNPPCSTDVVVLPDYTIANVATPIEGVLLDYEVHDKHSPQQTVNLMSALANLAHTANLKFTLYTNPMDDPDFAANGIFRSHGSGSFNVSNTDAILSLVDYFGLALHDGNPSGTVEDELAAEINDFQNPLYSKFEVIWGLLNQPSEASAVYNTITGDGFAGVIFWPERATFGSSNECDVVNQQIGYLTGIPPTGC